MVSSQHPLNWSRLEVVLLDLTGSKISFRPVSISFG
ncbi:hypothetical protein E2C01_090708 [Portunus trituberculatus]|uniref:Uncharacterized protein n=1 Tax=Portunus trituberculatus TaxID=210409 RepID=A0A5B7JM27_PORTR|nr:hypothetical protein [Portunus trituberculatus]